MTVHKNNGKASVAGASAKPGLAPKPSTMNHAPAPEVAKPAEQPLTAIEEQMRYFKGLEILVNKCRRLENHKASVELIDLTEDELNQFENTHTRAPYIDLCDTLGHDYEIRNPRLLAEVKQFLIERLNVKIAEFEEQILTYGKQPEA